MVNGFGVLHIQHCQDILVIIPGMVHLISGMGVQRTGDVKHHAIDRYIFWGQHGEFWKGSQVNKWHMFYDNGLMIGQFGFTGPDVKGLEAPYGMAGNQMTGSVVKING
jgi:hypothetical protein